MKKTLLLILFVFTDITLFAQNEADIDPTFNTGTGFNGTVNCTKLLPNGDILVAGYFNTYNGIGVGPIIRLNNDGSLDTDFNANQIGINNYNLPGINTIELQSNGKILIGGHFAASGNIRYITRLNTNGTTDSTLQYGAFADFNGPVYAISAKGGGTTLITFLVGGSFTTYKGFAYNSLIMLQENGDVHGNYGTKFTGSVNVLTEDALGYNSKTLVGGKFLYSIQAGITLNPIMRLNDDYNQTANTTYYGEMFINGGSGITVNAITKQPDGKFLVGGSFTRFNLVNYNRIVRLNSNLTIDNSFTTNQFNLTDTQINAITVCPNGEILVGYNTSAKLIKLNSNGTLGSNFNVQVGFSTGAIIKNINLLPNGKVLVGGEFTTYRGGVNNRLVRLKGTTTLSTNDFTKQTISLHPNPVNDILNISLPENTSIENYEIYDLQGKKIISEKTTQNNINVSELSNGIYVIKVITNEGILTNKFIKE